MANEMKSKEKSKEMSMKDCFYVVDNLEGIKSIAHKKVSEKDYVLKDGEFHKFSQAKKYVLDHETIAMNGARERRHNIWIMKKKDVIRK